LNTSCSIDHDNYLKNFSSAGPGAVTGGNVVVGEQSHLGLGCVVKDQINISKNTIIGSASLVNKNCEKNSIYFGTPAKKIRLRLSNENYL
jgi:acetyltransferase EpsM